MTKLPKPVLISIFLVMCGLLFFVICLIRTLYGQRVVFEELEFFVILGIIGFLGMLLGITFILPFKTWTSENFVDRQENVITINKLIMNLYEKKMMLKQQIPALNDLPDCVQVVISPHKILISDNRKTEKMKRG